LQPALFTVYNLMTSSDQTGHYLSDKTAIVTYMHNDKHANLCKLSGDTYVLGEVGCQQAALWVWV